MSVKRSSLLVRVLVAVAMAAVALAVPLAADQPEPAQASACAVSTSFPGGDGSVANPFQIATAADLLYLASDSALWTGNHFVQTADIDLVGCDWTPIGDSPFGNRERTEFDGGSFDGGGFLIDNVGVSVSASSSYVGFFGYTKDSEIRRVRLDITIPRGGDTVGGLIGLMEAGSVDDATVMVDIAGLSGGNIGGLVGEAWSTSPTTISAVTVAGRIEGNYSFATGGLVGMAYGSTLAVNDVTVSADVAFVRAAGQESATGGVIGESLSSNTRMARVTFDGAVTATAESKVGGLIGEHRVGSLTLTDSSVAGTASVQGLSNVGGVIGLVGSSTPLLSVSNVSSLATVTSSGSADADTGGVIGELAAVDAVLDGITVSGVVDGGANGARVGGLIGFLNTSTSATVTSSSVGATVSGEDQVGGVVGQLLNTNGSVSFDDVTSTGDVLGREYVGGFVGEFVLGVRFNLSATGTAFLSNSTTSGSVAQTSASMWDAGGFIGAAGLYGPSSLELTGVDAMGPVTGGNEVGGLVGGLYVNDTARVVVSDAEARGSIAAREYAGGLIGALYGSGVGNGVTVSVSSARGSVVAENGFVGGLVGFADVSGSLTISDTAATGSVTNSALNSSVDSAGGLIGTLETGNAGATALVTRSFATGDVDNGRYYGGGLIGEVVAGLGTIEISESFATGAVINPVSNYRDSFGGLIGKARTRPGTTLAIRDVYATGDVTGMVNEIGGLVGSVDGSSGTLTIENAYSIGQVIDPPGNGSDLGGLVGRNSGTVTGSFWDTTASQVAVSAAGDGKSTTDMKKFATFTGAGWSITNGGTGPTIWGICDGLTYPFLMWEDITVPASCGVSPGGSAVLPPALPGLVSQPVSPSTSVPSSSVPSTTRPPSSTVPPVSSTVPAPVPDGGVLPELVPGASQVITDGVATNVDVFVDNSTDLVLRGQDFELRLAGECSNGCTIDTTSDGRQVLTLEERGLASVSGEGFLAGTPVYVWLFSEPRFLGELRVNADGTFAGSVALGDIEVGEHTLQVNGTSFDGKPRTANLGVVVNPGQVPAPGPGVLPATGGDTASLLLITLLLLGAGAVVLGRRPLRSRQEAAH